MNKPWVIEQTFADWLRASINNRETIMHVFRSGDVMIESPYVANAGRVAFREPDEVIAMLQDAKQLRWDEYREPWPEEEAQEGSSDDGQSSP